MAIFNIVSDSMPISFGVPQGSALGPLLFLIFINDLPNSSDNLEFILFADDSTLSYKFDHSQPLVTDLLSRELSKVYDWLLSNKIKINIGKTKHVVFSYRRKITLDEIVMGDGEILRETSVKFLGVYMDENLNFAKHIGYATFKMAKSVAILNKLKYFLPHAIMRLSLIHI